jgi:predicted cupin superfamily sugar epimerase
VADKNTELIETYKNKLNAVHGQISRTTAMFYILCCAQYELWHQVTDKTLKVVE